MIGLWSPRLTTWNPMIHGSKWLMLATILASISRSKKKWSKHISKPVFKMFKKVEIWYSTHLLWPFYLQKIWTVYLLDTLKKYISSSVHRIPPTQFPKFSLGSPVTLTPYSQQNVWTLQTESLFQGSWFARDLRMFPKQRNLAIETIPI